MGFCTKESIKEWKDIRETLKKINFENLNDLHVTLDFEDVADIVDNSLNYSFGDTLSTPIES